MEDTLRVVSKTGVSTATVRVLILVLMEDTLRDFSVTGYICKDAVLILVLMEDTLREVYILTKQFENKS